MTTQRSLLPIEGGRHDTTPELSELRKVARDIGRMQSGPTLSPHFRDLTAEALRLIDSRLTALEESNRKLGLLVLELERKARLPKTKR